MPHLPVAASLLAQDAEKFISALTFIPSLLAASSPSFGLGRIVKLSLLHILVLCSLFSLIYSHLSSISSLTSFSFTLSFSTYLSCSLQSFLFLLSISYSVYSHSIYSSLTFFFFIVFFSTVNLCSLNSVLKMSTPYSCSTFPFIDFPFQYIFTASLSSLTSFPFILYFSSPSLQPPLLPRD